MLGEIYVRWNIYRLGEIYKLGEIISPNLYVSPNLYISPKYMLGEMRIVESPLKRLVFNSLQNESWHIV